MQAEQYNKARAGSLWLTDELPERLRSAGDPGSAAFADEVRSVQSDLLLTPDGKLGPRTWEALRASYRPATNVDLDEIPVLVTCDRRVDSAAEARERIARGFRYCRHLQEIADDVIEILKGNVTIGAARRVYRAMRNDGRLIVAKILAKGEDAKRAYIYKGRTADQMRRNYSRRWHRWIDNDRRYGMGTHWTAGTGSAYAAADYLLRRKPGRVSSNVFIDYDGSCFIAYPTILDPEIEDHKLIFTAHGAHNPGCFGVDFTSPGFLARGVDGRWRSKYGATLRDEIVEACGVVTLKDRKLKSWTATPTDAVPWICRKRPGTVYSVDYFLAPSWEQLASYIVLGRVHAALCEWKPDDLVVVGHYQRSDSRADPFYYPLAWIRSSILEADNVLDPAHWLARINPAEVNETLTEYRREVAGSGW